jgi:hypothetical protein
MWHRFVLNKDLLLGLLVRTCFRLPPFAMMPLLTIIVAGFWEAIVCEVIWLNARFYQVSFVISISHSFSNKRSSDAIAGEGFGENQFPRNRGSPTGTT